MEEKIGLIGLVLRFIFWIALVIVMFVYFI